MPITTAQLKAAIEAKIAAATGSTSLEDLTLIKNNADTWLANNSGGTITGYASLEALIQSKQNALTGSSTLDDITLTSASAFPPITPEIPYKTKLLITSSQSYTIPAGVFVIRELRATGGGGAGGGGSSSSLAGAGGGGAASTAICRNIPVQPGDVLTISIGAGGLAFSGLSGGAGGSTTVRLNGMPIVIAPGGNGGTVGAGGGGGGGARNTSSLESLQIIGGSGGNGAPAGVTGSAGSAPAVGDGVISGITTASGGTAGNFRLAGGGGGSSIYGLGGNGANGSNSGGVPIAGSNATLPNYGAGGGGATGGDSSNNVGGIGVQGVVELII